MLDPAQRSHLSRIAWRRIVTSVTTYREICRVCGLRFTAKRLDARTCSSTCRQRLRRGGAFAYFTTLTKAERRREREIHTASDNYITTHKRATAARRKARASERKLREHDAKIARDKAVEIARHNAETERLAAAMMLLLEEERERSYERVHRGVVIVLKTFVQEKRNDLSAEAIAAYMNRPDLCPLDLVTEVLADLKASGDYDRIIAEAA